MAHIKLAVVLIGSALAGSGFVAATLTWLSRNPASEAPTQVAESSPTAIPNKVETPASAQVAAPEAKTETPDPMPVVAEPAKSATEAQVAEQPIAAPASSALPKLDPTRPPAPPHPPGEISSPARSETVTADKPAAATGPRLRIDPLDIDPEGLDISTLLHPEAAAQPAVSAADEPPAPSVASEAAEAAEADAAAAAAAARPVVDRDASAPPNAAALLVRRLPSVKVERMPLCRFLDFATQLSGLPVSVAPEQLAMARASAASVVSVDAKDATIEQLLSLALGPLRLSPKVGSLDIRVEFADAARERELVYPIDDLASDAAEAQQLAGWIQALAAPRTWQSAGGAAPLTIEGQTLRIRQPEGIQYETLLFLERYRLARGLAPRSKYPVELLPTQAGSADLAKRMQGSTTFTFSEYTPLREVFRYWQEELAAPVLVDWPALAEERLWPHSRIVTSAIDKPWSTALDESLAKLNLAWRPAGGRTIEITTLAKAKSEPQLEIYRLAAEAKTTSDDIAAKVQELSGATGATETDGAATIFDAAHRVLMVRQPAVVERALRGWLIEQRSARREVRPSKDACAVGPARSFGIGTNRGPQFFTPKPGRVLIGRAASKADNTRRFLRQAASKLRGVCAARE